MNSKLIKAMGMACLTVLVLVLAVGCSSNQNRVQRVITLEIEKCKESTETFYEVEIRSGANYEILTELCHLEPSEVSMSSEWTGTLTTGPLEWTARENEDTRAMELIRVSWDDFDRALRHRATDPTETSLVSAERSFAAAQEDYGDSSWLRMERLRNLLDLRATTRSTGEDNPADIGDEARAYFEEVAQWAEDQGLGDVKVEAHLAVIEHLTDFQQRYARSIQTLDRRDEQMETAIRGAEHQEDRERVVMLTEELAERRANRPEEVARLQSRIDEAERVKCELRQGLSVDDVEDSGLRDQLTTLLEVECESALAQGEDDEDGAE